ncbi:excinuclease ABC subunit C [Helicobacter pullorum]|uniref:excinuclease ABC subunit UvrC n=1 Tax=Helicobacter pullorum TaxID=35818 RepID=UPI0008169008|nr:excinuclease ABC subunit UvrC [Helicobacter pullorum]OCR04444.1 excinuclease ABC subunit C [Helicobacter pullorum]OCR06486.1 excinuclease ABC subunit C [Helicobacter pullorum]OCR09922.1 excinuclease ABC subunit C [Helicobacter pullorum]OCR10192.1 excinuclease ABC subunit C [Helicobacter pullorum]
MTEAKPLPLNESLAATLKKLPNKSGVYHYFDSEGRLLYIGKAKNLKNRIKSYFRFTPNLSVAPNLSARISQMVSQIASMRYIVVENENDALILENSLIKQLKPKYNILLRDDKTYPYLCVDISEDYPRILLTRKVFKSQSIHYFGPYSSGGRDLLDSLYETFPLAQKESCLKGKKACLFYQIKRCLAPCEGKISKEDYRKILEQALECIQNPKKILAILDKKMQFLSENLRFEEAMVLRDRIAKIKQISPLSGVDFARMEDLDIFALEIEGNKGVLVKFFVRGGRVVSSASNVIKSQYELNIEEIYTQSLINYYSGEILIKPKQILIPYDLKEKKDELEQFLYQKLHKKIPIHCPKSGDKKQLCNLALKNAKESLNLNLTASEEILLDIQKLFGLQNMPYRIEIFDTSHHRGKQCVGAMVVYDERFIKESYRHYLLEGSDEYSQMKEMLQRRIEKFKEEVPPDLWVLDGGVGQINLAKDLLNSAGVNLEVVGISKEKLDSKAHRAKGAALDILRDEKGQEYRLKSSDKRLQFLQKLRDEAHRFAITFHQKQKQKTMQQSKVLEVKGVGKAIQKRLLAYFGSFEGIKKASLDELEKVLSKKLAKSVYEGLLEVKS